MKTHRKLFFTLLIASTTGIIHAQNVFNDPAINEEQRLDDLIARMFVSLGLKINQVLL